MEIFNILSLIKSGVLLATYLTNGGVLINQSMVSNNNISYHNQTFFIIYCNIVFDFHAEAWVKLIL
jgi:hypothetical protein